MNSKNSPDNAGHLSYDGVILPIDTSAPVLDVQITGKQGDNSWFITPPTVTLSATDTTSGVIGVLYQLENEGQAWRMGRLSSSCDRDRHRRVLGAILYD